MSASEGMRECVVEDTENPRENSIGASRGAGEEGMRQELTDDERDAWAEAMATPSEPMSEERLKQIRGRVAARIPELWRRDSTELLDEIDRLRGEVERLKVAKDQMHDQRHEEARNADLLRDALAKTDAMFRAARDEAGRAHRKYSFLKIQRDQLQSAISRAIRLLPRDGAEEASTLEMMIEARGYLKEALRESGEVKE